MNFNNHADIDSLNLLLSWGWEMTAIYSEGVKNFMFSITLLFFVVTVGVGWSLTGGYFMGISPAVDIELNEQELVRVLNDMRSGREIIVKKKTSQGWVIQMKKSAVPEGEIER